MSDGLSCSVCCTLLYCAVRGHAMLLCCACRWEPCSDVLHYTHTVGSMIPVHKELLDAGLRGLVLSGQGHWLHLCLVLLADGTSSWVLAERQTHQVCCPGYSCSTVA